MKKSKKLSDGIKRIQKRQIERASKTEKAMAELEPETLDQVMSASDADFFNDVREELEKRLIQIVSDFNSIQDMRGGILTLLLEDGSVAVSTFDLENRKDYRIC